MIQCAKSPIQSPVGGGPQTNENNTTDMMPPLVLNHHRNLSSSSSDPLEHAAQLNNTGVAATQSAVYTTSSVMDIPTVSGYFHRSLDALKTNHHQLSFQPLPSVDTALMESLPGQPMTNTAAADASVHRDFDREEYDEGMNAFSAMVPMDGSATSFPCAATIVLYNLGLLHVLVKQDETAEKCFTSALNLARWSTTLDLRASGLSVTAILHNLANIEYRRGNLAESIGIFQKALESAKSVPGSETSSHSLLEISATLNCLGVVFFHLPTSETEQALAYCTEALTIQRAVHGSHFENVEIATILNNIGRVEFMKLNYKEALEYYQLALQIRRSMLGELHLDVAATVYNAGQSYHQLGQLETAMSHYNKFLTIAKHHFGDQHRDIAVMIKCIAQIYHEKKEFETAKNMYMEALEMSRLILGKNHPEIASTLNKLGNLYYEHGDYALAIAVYNEGLGVERAILEPNHPNIVVTLTNLVSIHSRCKRLYCSRPHTWKKACLTFNVQITSSI